MISFLDFCLFMYGIRGNNTADCTSQTALETQSLPSTVKGTALGFVLTDHFLINRKQSIPRGSHNISK